MLLFLTIVEPCIKVNGFRTVNMASESQYMRMESYMKEIMSVTGNTARVVLSPMTKFISVSLNAACVMGKAH